MSDSGKKETGGVLLGRAGLLVDGDDDQ